MKVDRAMLKNQLEEYQESLVGLSSFVKELKSMTAKHGTDTQQFEEDLMEAQHNISFYEAEIIRIKKLIGGSAMPGPGQPGAGTILPQTPKQALSSLIFASIGFIAGAILGSRLKSRDGSEDSD